MNDIIIFIFYGAIALSAYLSGRDPTIPAVCVAAFLGLVLLREHRERRREDFTTQLRSYRQELRSGGTVVVDNLLLRYDTPVTTYNLNVGFLVGSVLVPSPYRIHTGDAHYEPLLYSIISLITGWWALPPAGPLATLALVRQNLIGGMKTDVAHLIDAKLFNQTDDLNAIFAPPEEEKEEKPPLPQTGAERGSEKLMRKRSATPSNPTLHERIQDYQSPRPPGIKLRETVSSRLTTSSEALNQELAKGKERLKTKLLSKRASNKTDKIPR